MHAEILIKIACGEHEEQPFSGGCRHTATWAEQQRCIERTKLFLPIFQGWSGTISRCLTGTRGPRSSRFSWRLEHGSILLMKCRQGQVVITEWSRVLIALREHGIVLTVGGTKWQDGASLSTCYIGQRSPVYWRDALDRCLGGLNLSCGDQAGKIVGNEIEGFLAPVRSAALFPALDRQFVFQI